MNKAMIIKSERKKKKIKKKEKEKNDDRCVAEGGKEKNVR